MKSSAVFNNMVQCEQEMEHTVVGCNFAYLLFHDATSCASRRGWTVLGAGWGAGPLVFLGLEFVLVI